MDEFGIGGGMDMLARPRESSIVVPVSAIRPFLLVLDELEDEESSVRDFRAGAAPSLFGSNGTADTKEEERSSAMLLPRWEIAALSRLTVRDRDGISRISSTCAVNLGPYNFRAYLLNRVVGPR